MDSAFKEFFKTSTERDRAVLAYYCCAKNTNEFYLWLLDKLKNLLVNNRTQRCSKIVSLESLQGEQTLENFTEPYLPHTKMEK
jgi:hypothetical protein